MVPCQVLFSARPSPEQHMTRLIACPTSSRGPWVKSAALQALDGHQGTASKH